MKLRTLAAGTAAVAIGSVAIIGFAPSAHADSGADLSIFVASSTIAQDSPLKFFRLDIQNTGPEAVTDTQLSFDFSGLDAGMVQPDLTWFDTCDVVGLVATCPYVPLAAGETWTEFVPLTNAGTAGPAGSFTAEFTSDVPDPFEADNLATVDVEVVGSGGDLQTAAFDVAAGFDGADLPIPVTPGEEAEFFWWITNEGDTWVHGIEFTLTLPAFVEFIDQYTVCDYGDPGVAVCSDPDAVLAPGTAYAPEEPTRVEVSSLAPGPMVWGGGHVGADVISVLAEPPPVALAAAPAAGFLDELDEQALRELVEDSEVAPALEVDPGDNSATFVAHVGAGQPNDLAVTSQPAEGEVGEVIEVTFTVTNHGPVTSGPFLHVTAPSGTVVPRDPEGFDPGSGAHPDCRSSEGSFDWTEATELTCNFEGELQAGVTLEFTLPFEIRSEPVGSDGLVTVNDVFDLDSNPDNDTAPIVITVASTGGSGGGLPVTGAQVGLFGGLGGAALAAGVVLLLVARRRRVVLVAAGCDG